MKRTLLLLLSTLLLISTLFANDKIKFQKVRIPVQNGKDIITLQKIGIDFEGAYFEKNKFIELIVADYEKEKIENAGFNYSVQIDDMSKFYASRLYNKKGKGFGYGSMGGFYIFDEVVEQLDSMYSQFPNLITQKSSIGTSTLGRPVYAVQISNNPGSDDGDPEMLYTALHHAREPQGMMVILYYMWYLLENYGTDAEATYIINNRQLCFVPVVNPDGYVHNQETDPGGGGMWRKTGRDNDSDGDNFDYNDGVDPNRNYEYEWGDQWGGSSSDPSDQTYRGPEPFSEPELQAIRDFCNVHQFRAALNYHTYSNLLLYPWGYDNVACEDDGIFASLAAEMTVVNNYTTGRPGNAIGYNANGSSDDWMYGEQVTKSKIFAFTPEVGSYSDGFWPSTDRIIPLVEENLYMNIYIAKAIGGAIPKIQNLNLITYGQNNAVDPGETSEISFNFANSGFEETSGLTAKIVTQDTMINTFNHIINLPEIAAFSQSEVTQTLAFQLDYSCDPGETKNIVVGVFDGEEMLASDTLSFVVSAVETVYFSDNAESGIANWNVDSPWGITTADFYSESHSFTDSPDGEYTSSIDVSLTSSVINLQNTPNATLQYYTKWNIEDRWDFAVVEISTDAESNWSNLRGIHMEQGSGSGEQESNEYGYDNTSSGWVFEEIELNDYIGNDVQIRFRLKTDVSVTYDGWYVDDIKIKVDSVVNNKPPFIQWVSYEEEVDFSDFPLTIRTKVIDDEEVERVDLFYTFFPDDGFDIIEMILSDTCFEATIESHPFLDTLYYYVQAKDTNDYWAFYPYYVPINALKIAILNVTDITAGNTKPSQFRLLGNYPNPFNPETMINYLIPKVTNVELSIYNSLGQRIRTFNINRQPAGEHQIKWDGKDETGRQVASGIYLYHLKAGDNITAGKMIFMK